MAEVTYYYDTNGADTWTTDPGNLIDNNTATFASSSTNGDLHDVTGNTCPGTDLGAITKVEYRVYGYVEDTSRNDIGATPRFGGSASGSRTVVIDVLSAAWSNYVDITTDTNAPSSWAWSDVQNLDIRLDAVRLLAQTRVCYAAVVELRVTYTPSGGGGTVIPVLMQAYCRRL